MMNMRFEKPDINVIEIKTSNCTIIVKDRLTDKFKRDITSITIIPIKFIGSNKVIRVGGKENIKCITLKKKNR